MTADTVLIGQILSDQETKNDLLNYESIATTIVKLLQENPNQPITIGVHGDWGAGKSSILEMIETSLEEKEDILCLKFNGWRFQGFEDAKIALLEGIVTGLLEKRPALNKAVDEIKETWKSIDWLKVAKKAGGLAFTAVTGIPSGEIIQTVTSAINKAISNPETLASPEQAKKAFMSIKDCFETKAESKKVPEEIRAFHKAFENLLARAEISQFVILIDDLDRCLPEVAIETLEAIRLFVLTSKTAFVIATDETMIEYSVRKHFPDYPETSGSQTYARNYLEKLIQVPFRIPSLGKYETKIYVLLLLSGAELGFDDPDFLKLVRVYKEKLKRPWEVAGLDTSSLSELLGKKTEQLQNAFFLSEQMGGILGSGTNGNPRQIKRFINTLLLRKRIADARGFGADIKLPILAKIMLAERFIPSLFEKLGELCVAAPKGQCEELSFFEKANKDLQKGDQEKAQEVESKINEVKLLKEWKDSQNICAWMAVEPEIGDIDLRPYFFIAKDRKENFGSLTALGPIEILIEKLLRPKIGLMDISAELKRLTNDEAEKVFAGVRTKIFSNDTFDKEPKGIAGVRELVAAKPILQEKLVEMLASIPIAKLGAWVAQGWDKAITSPEAKGKFQKQLESWQNSENKVLKAATGAMKKIQMGKQ